jgi:hypothetical protein
MNIIIDLSNIMYNDLWMWNKTKLNSFIFFAYYKVEIITFFKNNTVKY